ncbi:MAG TPA: hypothetical protein VHC69_05870 [Polyangiaceae bacterium]|nr:hypothetical protein [Polyangiaceae bacterium]
MRRPREAPGAARTVLLCALLFCAPAHADDASQPAAALDDGVKDEARAAYQEGVTAYQAGDFASAFAHFKRAHDLVPALKAEYWMAMSASKGTDVVAARALLEHVLASPELEKLGADKVAAARARLAELGTGEKETDASSVAPAPTSAPLLTADEPQAERRPAWPAYATLGGAAAFGIFATTYGILALNANDENKVHPSTAHHDAAERDALFAAVGAVMTVGLGITGFVLISGRSAPAKATSSRSGRTDAARLTLGVTPAFARGNGASVRVSLSL